MDDNDSMSEKAKVELMALTDAYFEALASIFKLNKIVFQLSILYIEGNKLVPLAYTGQTRGVENNITKTQVFLADTYIKDMYAAFKAHTLDLSDLKDLPKRTYVN